MPRAIRIQYDGGDGLCDLTGMSCHGRATSFVERSYGFTYPSEEWIHPFAAYSVLKKKDKKTKLPVRPRSRIFSLRDLDGLAFNKSQSLVPSAVSQKAFADREEFLNATTSYGFWVFGFVTDKARVEAFVSSRVDFSELDPDILRDVVRLVSPAAEVVLQNFRKALVQLPRLGGDFRSFIDTESAHIGRRFDEVLSGILSRSIVPDARTSSDVLAREWFFKAKDIASSRLMDMADVGSGFDPRGEGTGKDRKPQPYEVVRVFNKFLAGRGAEGSKMYEDLGIFEPAQAKKPARNRKKELENE